ncbi:MAG: bacteriophage abortive infection AbiH family protein [Clostridiales bacterium]|nr:bacteriophage abortive infection AbiH family protein [Clostridiales bacterium]
MSRLYVIGNGFDCFAHGNSEGPMKTKYQDFRDYLIKNYPDCVYHTGIPEKTLTADHHDYDYNDNDMVGYIVKTLDDCEDGYWCTIEEAVGASVFDEFSFAFDDDYDKMDDKEESWAIENNNETAENIKAAFSKIKDLFYDWVSYELAEIDYSSYPANPSAEVVFNDVSAKDSFYVTFNYTRTLEEIYKVADNNVCHPHGIVGDPKEYIIFGHGAETPDRDKEFYLYQSTLNDLHEELRKNTLSPKYELKNWLDGIKDITEIYSYGFSFSEVDLGYIEEIKNHVNLLKTVWYLNNYDYTYNPEYKKKLENLGFTVKPDMRW